MFTFSEVSAQCKFLCNILFPSNTGFITQSDQVNGFNDQTLLARQVPELPFSAKAKLPWAGPFSHIKIYLWPYGPFEHISTCCATSVMPSGLRTQAFYLDLLLCTLTELPTTFTIRGSTDLQTIKHKRDGLDWCFPSVHLVFCLWICANSYCEHYEPTSSRGIDELLTKDVSFHA